MTQQLKNLIKQYYNQNFAQKKFIPGQTPVPAWGKIFDEKELELMIESVLDGWWTEGRFNSQFEKKLADWLGCKFCMTTNSGSSANLLAISSLTSFRLGKIRLKKDDEIITVAAGFPTTINSIIQNNLVPVFVDIDLGTYNINIQELEKAVSPKTRAVFLAHTLGNPFNLEEVIRICKKYNLFLIEDNCDSLGSIYKNKKTGTFGHLSTLSFYPAHHITMGEGGAVLTNCPLVERIIKSLRDWGRDCYCHTGHDNSCGKRYFWQLGDLPFGYDHKYIYSEIGYNLKITDMQAALGLAQLDKLDSFIKKRQENFDFLYDNLYHLDGIEKYFILPQKQELSQPSWFGFPITLKDNCPFTREDLLKYLDKYKIATRLLFAGNIIKQPHFKNYEIKFRKAGDLKNTDKVMKDTFCLGIYPGVDKEKLGFVLEKIKDFLSKHKK